MEYSYKFKNICYNEEILKNVNSCDLIILNKIFNTICKYLTNEIKNYFFDEANEDIYNSLSSNKLYETYKYKKSDSILFIHDNFYDCNCININNIMNTLYINTYEQDYILDNYKSFFNINKNIEIYLKECQINFMNNIYRYNTFIDLSTIRDIPSIFYKFNCIINTSDIYNNIINNNNLMLKLPFTNFINDYIYWKNNILIKVKQDNFLEYITNLIINNVKDNIYDHTNIENYYSFYTIKDDQFNILRKYLFKDIINVEPIKDCLIEFYFNKTEYKYVIDLYKTTNFSGIILRITNLNSAYLTQINSI